MTIQYLQSSERVGDYVVTMFVALRDSDPHRIDVRTATYTSTSRMGGKLVGQGELTWGGIAWSVKPPAKLDRETCERMLCSTVCASGQSLPISLPQSEKTRAYWHAVWEDRS